MLHSWSSPSGQNRDATSHGITRVEHDEVRLTERVACRASWPQLASVGRQFKQGAYTLTAPREGEQRQLLSFDEAGPPPVVPLAAFRQASVRHTARTNTTGTEPARSDSGCAATCKFVRLRNLPPIGQRIPACFAQRVAGAR